MNMLKENVIKRLAFIKYILNQGDYQSRLPEPICASCLLSFHDSIELFLQLIAEELGVKAEDIHLMEYWEKINPKLTELKKDKLTQNESIRRLNKSRVWLKHHGHFPSKLDIEHFRVLTNTFFQENAKNVFDINFDEISLIELIPYKKCKEYLNKAQQNFNENNIKESIISLAISFSMLLKEYEHNKRSQYGDSPFFFGDDMSFLSSFFIGIDHNDKLSRFVDSVRSSITSMQTAIKILSFGIDYKQFVKFSLITPHVTFIPGRENPLVTSNLKLKLTKEDFEFCYNFIIESALKLKEFDFAVLNEEIRKPNLSDYV